MVNEQTVFIVYSENSDNIQYVHQVCSTVELAEKARVFWENKVQESCYWAAWIVDKSHESEYENWDEGRPL